MGIDILANHSFLLTKQLDFKTRKDLEAFSFIMKYPGICLCFRVFYTLNMAQKFKIYQISCGKCGAYVLTYHKHGAGKGILRLYLGNIAGPDQLVTVLSSDFNNVKEVPNLSCPSCQEVLGVPIISKGKKWAFRMRQGYFHRKLQK